MQLIPSPPSTRCRRRLWISLIPVATAIALALFILNRAASFNPTEDLKAAEKALADDNPALARNHLNRVLQQSPMHQRALLLAIQAARRTNAYADAERFLIAYEQKYSASLATNREWMLIGVQQGDFGDAEERLQSDVAGHDLDTPAILEAIAKGYDVSFRWEEAIAALTALIQHRPDHVPALILRGTIRARGRQLDEAERDLRRAVELRPNDAAAHGALADLLTHRGHSTEAIYQFELAMRDGPTPAYQIGIARALADSARISEAEKQLDQLLTDHPDHIDGRVERGRLALRQNQFTEAEEQLKHATEAAPWHRDGHRLLLIALKEQGKTDAAARCEARLAELRHEDGLLGRLKLRARDHGGDADCRWQLWLQSPPTGLSVEEKFAWLTEVLRIDPDRAEAHAAMAEYFERAGQPRRAAQHRAKVKSIVEAKG